MVAGAPGLPGAGAPEGPDDEDGLEEEADEAGGVGVEAEGVDAVDVLGDVAGEDEDEEDGDEPAYEGLVAGQNYECGAEDDFDDAGEDDDEVTVEGQPGGNLGEELGAPCGEMADAGGKQGEAQEQAGDVLQEGGEGS